MRASAIASRIALIVAVVVAITAPARAQPKGDDESSELVDEGRRALRGKRYGEAAKALDQAIALNPRRIEAYVLRAAVHAARAEYGKGVALLRKAKALAPGNVDVLSGLGTQLVLGGDTVEGIAVLEGVVAKAPDRYEAQSLLGKHHAANEDWPKVVIAVEAYLKARPAELAAEDPVHSLRLAEAYLRADRAPAARALYEKVLKVLPDEPAARMGLAWSLAAISCRQALEVLDSLDDLAPTYPEITLVSGQCALALDDASAALRLGERYLAAMKKLGRPAAATGHALVGEAAAATGDLPLARTRLSAARDLEPGKRRWGLKLAIVLRRAGDGADALAELDRMGPPASPSADPVWWRERGEALIVAERAAEVAAELAVALEALPGDGELRTIAGEAALRAGDVAAALVHLDAGDQAGRTARSKAWLVRALEADAAARLAAGDLAGAEPVLARADELGAGPANGRNLGIARLALGRAADAIAPLERAVLVDPAAETLVVLARAQLALGEVAKARAGYAQAAAKARGDAFAVRIAIDRAALEVEAGQGAAALDAIDGAKAEAKAAGGELRAEYKRAQLAASHAAGVAALRAGSASKAVALLDAADDLAGGKDVAVRCDLALATVATGDRDASLRRLRAVAKVTCPFPAPANTQAVPILIAFIEGVDPKRADKALKALAKLDRKSSGATRRLLATATRVVAMGAAERAYDDGDLKKARKLLEVARKAEARAGADELSLDLAVLDIVDGKLDAAAAALEKLAPKIPEAMVNLGVIADRRGDGVEALAQWRQARRAGVKFGPLDDWIDAKERIYGGDR